ncbi:MAG TPA: bifunctional alpha,alpha-trehalose-phosphate synthase (UDP-forming)/trehalose-phosphatase, partial [Candidatus Deferrimicrobium sp.]|nr:bifunctional alpha,alpha-trehalose-phosphate synthase (UDP-forming)/trehalose-phosphatase [Candidatus Deferrimicrobium sp.]
MSAKQRLLVVSNRLPLTATRVSGRWRSERSAGGLVAAMAPLMQRYHGLWLGWSGDALPDEPAGRARLMQEWEERHGYVAVDIPAKVSRSFYEGYANDTLWPLLHGFVTRVSFQPESWLAYRDANQRFADAVLARMRARDLVWVHDYQLMLVPRMLRERAPEARIGFFLHIPFPSSDIFRTLPEREAILLGLLGSDSIAFQTHGDLHDFRRSLLQVLGLESQMDRVFVDGRTIRLAALPIGIQAAGWRRLASSDRKVAGRIVELRDRHRDRKLLVSVDRLDYTKGIPERLRTFRRLLKAAPSWRGRVTLVQVAVPSRERVPAYAELRREVAELVGEVNGEFGTPEWQPVVYMRRAVDRAELAALYSAADVAWVGPLRDGMNLVAKEYVACQQKGSGVLVLSEFAGAAQELGEALRINPYDEEGTAEVILRALEMDEESRTERMAALHERVVRNDAVAWAERFIDGLREATKASRQATRDRRPAPDPVALGAAFDAARTRLILLDYDGTLVPIARRPQDVVPGRDLCRLLAGLASTPRTTVAVISGRGRPDIARWFGDTPGLWLAAEHGALVRPPDGSAWEPLRAGADLTWKQAVRPVLEQFADSAPGSFVEEKELALAWHYRLADAEFGSWLANELVATLENLLAGTEATVLHGSKVVEVRFAWANKGELAGRLSAGARRGALILAIGDDRTDEDMFA